MNMLQKIDPKVIQENAIQLIGEEWMLIAAGNADHFNMMTASWGMMGFLWNKPVVTVFVRPQRYTFEFMENNAYFTLTFLGKENRKALNVCGSTSGRDVNKVEKSGLTPCFTSLGNPFFEEARLVLECKKIYTDWLKEDAFLEKRPVVESYPEKDFHKIYVGEIVNAWVKK